MAIKLIKDGRDVPLAEVPEAEILSECQNLDLECVLEWDRGQWWLHSDRPEEKPIGIEVDAVLRRHEEFFLRNSLHRELLARAVGIKQGQRPRVLDMTAGLLGDTLLLLSFGCEVVALERHPVIAFLIQSALKNAQHPKAEKLRFIFTDASRYLREEAHPPEVFFFDPMYEDANDKASPRKEMRIFRNVVRSDQDAEELAALAREKKPRRLVVKRPRLSRPIAPAPSVDYVGKSTRYDVYFA
jgi:16S rRNA (guanine1516-N2)-methyltransferase